jgi:hypothetical protein
MSMSHCDCEAEAPSSERIAGIATFTIVVSIDAISTARQHDIRMSHLRRVLSAPIGFVTQSVSGSGWLDEVGSSNFKAVPMGKRTIQNCVNHQHISMTLTWIRVAR